MKKRKYNIAILTGGDTEERVISLKSSAVVYKHLHSKKFHCVQIDIAGADWKTVDEGEQVNKNDFSVRVNGRKTRFDAIFAALHGSPLEDGKLQGYFDVLGIPYTCCNGFVSALTMNKHNTKALLAPHGIPMAKSFLLHKGHPFDIANLLSLGFPMFVKPNSHGSSFGVSKAKSPEDLQKAIDYAFTFDDEVVVEAFMPGREFGNGAFRHKGKVVVLPVTEIIPKTEFFDFAAKYEGLSEEVTPANISLALTRVCRAQTARIYEILQCSGVVRFDYILVGDTFHIIEANTIPGISEASIVPQQVVAHGWTLKRFFEALVEELLSRQG